MNSTAVCAVTGSTGYVGSVIADALSPRMKVVPVVRRASGPDSILWDFGSARDITQELRARNVTALVHAAWDMRGNTLHDLRRTAVAGSKRLYEMAKAAGVQRIVFISTISAFPGNRSAYGQAKLEVERMTTELGGVVIRPGLVFGPRSGGVFGTIRNQIRNGKFIPLIGSGNAPQYLLHEQTLKDVVERAVAGDFDSCKGEPITVAHPNPWPFRDLVSSIARAEKRVITLVPTPWPLLYLGLRTAELAKLKLPVRSDSVISFVYQNTSPDFSKLKEFSIDPLPYQDA